MSRRLPSGYVILCYVHKHSDSNDSWGLGMRLHAGLRKGRKGGGDLLDITSICRNPTLSLTGSKGCS